MLGIMFRIKNKNGNEIINMGRFNSKMLKRQLERELAEEEGLCVVGYRDPEKCLPTMIFFRKGGQNIIRGIENLDTSKVVYVNVFFKKGHWIMKISNALKERDYYESFDYMFNSAEKYEEEDD